VLATRADELRVEVRPTFGASPLHLESPAGRLGDGRGVAMTRLSGLLSRFALERVDGGWTELPGQVAWFDVASGRDAFTLTNVPTGGYRALRFAVGLDPEANHTDPARHAADHPLNPNLNGLHWSWQGGYIFLALEGRWNGAPLQPRAGAETGAPSSGGFSLHFANDWNLTMVTLPVALGRASEARLALGLDIARLLRDLDFARDGTSTHSREGDPLAESLRANLPGAFTLRSLAAGTRAPTAPSLKPLYLPPKFTPYRFTMSAVFPVPDLPRDNPLLEERVALGRALFHEPRLSRDNSISCASCHVEGDGFSDARRYSEGVEGRIGTRQAMPLFNLAWKSSFFWDGRAPSLRVQALMPIQDHAEMDETLERVMRKLSQAGEKVGRGAGEGVSVRRVSPLPPHSPAPPLSDYPTLFTAAFGSPEITPEKIGLALENFLLTLTSFDSKFDRAQRGEPGVTLTAQEQRGFELFFTEYDPRRGQFGADCFHCHGGANFSSHGFANNGLDATFTDQGRFNVTGREADRGRFSVPSLRNVALTAPYMHDGRFATLEEVIAHYTGGVKASATLDPNLAKHPDGGVPLDAADRAALVAFLQTLTEERLALPAATREPAPPRTP
jgi:cytochrome c peroxidase